MKKLGLITALASAILISLPVSATAATTNSYGNLDSKTIQIIEDNTPSATPAQHSKIIEEGDVVEVNSTVDVVLQENVDNVKNANIKRSDGNQIISEINSDNEIEISFDFPGKYLREVNGYIIVSDSMYGEPHAVIDPAWAVDTEGKEVTTYFKISGNTLTQVIHAEESSETIISDPYIRDAYTKNGTKFGQDLVFSRSETAKVASFGPLACAALVKPVLVVGCGTAPAVASHALYNNQCLSIRAIGSPYAPNLIFPIAVNC